MRVVDLPKPETTAEVLLVALVEQVARLADTLTGGGEDKPQPAPAAEVPPPAVKRAAPRRRAV